MTTEIDVIFAEDGPLARQWPNYESRPQQLRMAREVLRALDERMPVLIEAATGTGKTLAYLAAVWLSEKKVIISTNTKALQEQLFEKDIPLLQSLLASKRKVALVKGRRNYLCRLRLDEFQHRPQFRTAADAQHWNAIERWAETTTTGDRAEIPGLPMTMRPGATCRWMGAPAWVRNATFMSPATSRRCANGPRRPTSSSSIITSSLRTSLCARGDSLKSYPKSMRSSSTKPIKISQPANNFAVESRPPETSDLPETAETRLDSEAKTAMSVLWHRKACEEALKRSNATTHGLGPIRC